MAHVRLCIRELKGEPFVAIEIDHPRRGVELVRVPMDETAEFPELSGELVERDVESMVRGYFLPYQARGFAKTLRHLADVVEHRRIGKGRPGRGAE